MILGKETTYSIFLCQFVSSKKQMPNWIRYGKGWLGEMPMKNKGEETRWTFWPDESLTSLKERGKEGGLGIKSLKTAA